MARNSTDGGISDEVEPEDDETLDGDDIEALQLEQARVNRRLRNARKAEEEKRSLVHLSESVKDLRKNYDQTLERLTSYDTNDKARLFGYGAFTAPDGNLKWVRMDSVFAFEVMMPSVDSGHKAETWLRTVDGTVDVAESADEIMNEFQRVRMAYQAERVREVESELIRNQQRVEEREAKKVNATKTVAEAEVTLADLVNAGPDFRGVVNFDPDDEPEDGLDEEDDDRDILPDGAFDDDDDDSTTDNGGAH